ncbi:MAG: winged helix-turn-helix transcriptional regulator [Candidatus Lokiarchaeota archaeon]|nr:winged helix-turn-helix transcriptional regulator [Candidatus Lokiarchaeota archaeon]
MPTKKHLDTLLEIKDNPSLSQRSLAHKLNISLGLTNAILQNLIHRGWIKAQKMTGRKILYLITPQGMAKAANLVYDRFRETQNYYQYTKELLTSYLTGLYTKGKRQAVIYGTNQLAEITYLSLLDSPLKFYTIIFDDPLSSKKIFLGHEVLTISEFAQKVSETPNPENLIILSTVSQKENKIPITEIKKYKNISQKIKIINLEDILKNIK